ncbi:hypothetical protein [Oerskovia flava]|uniref:hypothetical protein n=1 Tax=Oerskovia flava TaxID=2986422 RepID=UPI00223EEF14|nr:hypothetical protein [Oerskovia sp. JB1-3-2]
MTWSEIAIVVVAVLLLAGWLLWVSASRLDRLHRKVVASRVALDAQLVRRSTAALDLATSGELDPASSILVAEAAYAALGDEAGTRELAVAVPDLAPDLGTAPLEGSPVDTAAVRSDRRPDGLVSGLGDERARAESDLSALLRAAFADPVAVAELRAAEPGDELLSALSGAWYRAQLARRFHNEAVAQTQRVRRKWYVRVFRIAGRASMPATVELDDAWPAALGRPLASTPR